VPSTGSFLTVAIRREEDILLVRQRARQISQFLGFSTGDITRITTAISEIARNAFEYGGGGIVGFTVESQAPERRELVIRVADLGPGIADVQHVERPDFKSRTGLGLGIKGSRALMDRFDISSVVGRGTSVVMAKILPRFAAAFGAAEMARLSDELAKSGTATPLGELQVQNQALLNTLDELKQRQAEIERLGVIAEEARARAEAAQHVAERSVVVRDRFMALTTHELRSPLNAVIGYLELLDMELAAAMTEKQKGYFARIQRASKHLLGVTNDFLDMAQGDAGRLKVARHEGAARHVISEASALIAPQAAARNVNVRLHEATEHLMYLGDAARVRQVLVNVLGNAVSFTPPGGSVNIIAARATEPPAGSALAADDGPWCTIRVEDAGPGIPSDKLGHVFEPFVQLSSDGQASRQGSGLGLTVSRQLSLLMRGDLTVASEGAGAVFTLWLAEGLPKAALAVPPAERERAGVT
jgi:signal transduction histidine kinase